MMIAFMPVFPKGSKLLVETKFKRFYKIH